GASVHEQRHAAKSGDRGGIAAAVAFPVSIALLLLGDVIKTLLDYVTIARGDIFGSGRRAAAAYHQDHHAEEHNPFHGAPIGERRNSSPPGQSRGALPARSVIDVAAPGGLLSATAAAARAVRFGEGAGGRCRPASARQLVPVSILARP